MEVYSMAPETLVRHVQVSISQKILLWLAPICMLIWLAAAFLHWQRNRHWCLLALSIALLLGTISTLTPYISMMIMSSGGSVQTVESLFAISHWAQLFAVLVGGVGGIGAIHWAITLRPKRR
jgi:hypothetical protein